MLQCGDVIERLLKIKLMLSLVFLSFSKRIIPYSHRSVKWVGLPQIFYMCTQTRAYGHVKFNVYIIVATFLNILLNFEDSLKFECHL